MFHQYEDEDHDHVVLASDSDLVAAVEHARSAGWKVCLRGLRCTIEGSSHLASIITTNDIKMPDFLAVAATFSFPLLL